jgi:hypothetical protein
MKRSVWGVMPVESPAIIRIISMRRRPIITSKSVNMGLSQIIPENFYQFSVSIAITLLV